MTLQEPSSGPEALSEALVFLNFFADLPDHRQAGKVIYPLPEILLLCLLAVLAGAESFVEIARFGEKKIALLRRFLPFKDGTPRTINSATSSQRLTQQYFSGASSPGLPASPGSRRM